MTISIAIQENNFDVGSEYTKLIKDNPQDGACVFFVGLVRDFNNQKNVTHLELEHYPQMAESTLNNICEQAESKFDIGRIRVIHRVGKLCVSDQIVFVGVTSQHREASFSAAQFIMDFLKHDVPIWKKEFNKTASEWVTPNAKEAKNKTKWTSTASNKDT